jgi:DNA repair exonuclease SbcCD ATPase subunit
MAYINFQPRPKVPPISFFQPISLDNAMTDVEFLLGVLKKLNEVIAQTNKNTQFIDEYTGKIEEIETEIANLRAEMTEFEEDVNDNIETQFIQIKLELQSMIATALNQANAYTDAIASQLRDEIEQISIGDITLYDPTTGVLSPLQTVIDNLYGTTREEALMASEYDNLLLSATEYDTFDNGEPLTAFNYDKFGKTLLV